MKSKIEHDIYNTSLETSDWRYSASIVGLIKYFNYLVDNGDEKEENLYKVDGDVIFYNSDHITEERYLLFVEKYFENAMHHRDVEKILSSDELSDEQEKLVKEKLKSNSIMKKVFAKTKFTGENKQEILKKIDEKRLSIVKETFRNGKSLYANFANINSLLQQSGDICRMINYDIDKGKKSKSISYNWNFKTYSYVDEAEFDFIPFAFSKSYESFFINNNFSIKQLYNTNNQICDSENPRSALFHHMKNSSKFINYDVEVIIKERNEDYFKTLYIRKQAIDIFDKIENYEVIKKRYKVNENYYINIEKEVTDSILNNLKLDLLIQTLLKVPSYSYTVKTLIDINILIYGGKEMDKQMKSAYACAKKVIKSIPENKVNSYKQKLISAITFRDNERFCEILLQLSSYSGVVFDFAYDLFEDFDANKNIAYTFINALSNQPNNNNGGNKNE
ncbi:type I CRISPR-associated protein Cas8a1/Csx8 [Clostridiaceae bacterium M8S5]|nr:type I CRISPR-associated protein Cas8a1/Csx8 [Clostridiaceae bacterium M8S5]